jgi:alcohol dehydrogenase (cytochrome c)
VSPPVLGGTNWYSPAYSPRTELFYVNAYGEQEYFIREEECREGEQYMGGGAQNVQPLENQESAIRALDPRTRDMRREFEIQPRSTSGLLATAGDLDFAATVDGYFFALDAEADGSYGTSPSAPACTQGAHHLRRERPAARHHRRR